MAAGFGHKNKAFGHKKRCISQVSPPSVAKAVVFYHLPI